MSLPGTYWCSCTARCRRAGQSGKWLSYSTFNKHATFRDADARDALHHQIVSNASSGLRTSNPRSRAQDPAVGTLNAPSIVSDPSGGVEPGISAEADGGSLPPGDEMEVDEASIEPSPQPEAAQQDDVDQAVDAGSLNMLELEDAIVVPPPDDDALEDTETSSIADIEQVQLFIQHLRRADINNGDLSPAALLRLSDPPRARIVLSEDTDHDLLLSLRLYVAHLNSPEAAYTASVRACTRAHPGDHLLSLHRVKRWMEDASGVSPIVHDMCPNSCVAFTGPLAAATVCPVPTCALTRLLPGTRRPRQQFSTIPLGPIIQAMHRDPVMSQQFDYGARRLAELRHEADSNGGRIRVIDDILCGSDVLDAYRAGRITGDDILLMISYDGCQIYRDKQSDCWIYIWIFLSLAPDMRYKLRAVQPGGFVPGPNKPKNFESFIFPGLHHIAAVNALPAGGLPVWQAHTESVVRRRLFIVSAGADGPAMTSMNGLVGHSGRLGCRFFCLMKGRRELGPGGHHYPCILRPEGDGVAEGSDHPDYVLTELPSAYSADYSQSLRYVCQSTSPTEYNRRRAATGIARPSILSGLGSSILGVPRMCGGDIMHLVINLGDLLLPLWRGTLRRSDSDTLPWSWATLTGRAWEQHGADVTIALSCLPGAFGRAPRNPAAKISSGYKQWEWLIYLFGLCPGLLYKVLPDQIWKSFCKLARGIRMLYEYRSSPEQAGHIAALFLEFMFEFEDMYYQRHPGRIHFVRQCIHVLHHYATDIPRIGPGLCSSQYPIERTIGNLTQELRLHSAPYANLSQRGFLRCTVNAVCAMIPGLVIEPAPSTSSIELGDGYALLPKCDQALYALDGAELDALRKFVPSSVLPKPTIVRWARLRLPNGQIIRSRFKETQISRQNLRNTRNAKLNMDGRMRFAEVHYYFQISLSTEVYNLCMATLYSTPDNDLYRESSGAVYSCTLTTEVVVVDVRAVQSVVAMVPHSLELLSAVGLRDQFVGRVFVVERPGLEVLALGEHESDPEESHV